MLGRVVHPTAHPTVSHPAPPSAGGPPLTGGVFPVGHGVPCPIGTWPVGCGPMYCGCKSYGSMHGMGALDFAGEYTMPLIVGVAAFFLTKKPLLAVGAAAGTYFLTKK